MQKYKHQKSTKNDDENIFLRILERDRGDGLTHDEVLSEPMGWRWAGEVVRKRKKAGKITDFTNCNDWSKPGPKKRF